eukprot:COSAG05_NODE_5455_length_1169_cov_1.273832_2_plen_60_part_01
MTNRDENQVIFSMPPAPVCVRLFCSYGVWRLQVGFFVLVCGYTTHERAREKICVCVCVCV